MSALKRPVEKLLVAVLAVAMSSLFSAGCGVLSGETKIDEGIVIAPKENIRSSTAMVSLPLAEVKRGDRLDILEQAQVKTPTRIQEWYKVKTKGSNTVEGWIQTQFVITRSIVTKMDELFEKTKDTPSQGVGRLKVQARLRAEPDGDVVTRLPRGSKVEIVSKARTVFKPEKREDSEEGDDVTPEAESRTVLWYQVRLPEGEVLRAGWIGAQQVQLDVPDEILHLEGEGRVFTGWVVFAQTKDRDGQMRDNYIATMKRVDSDTPFDFTRLWVLIYSPEGKRYFNRYLKDGLRGMLPITLTAESGRKGFTIHELDENNKPIPIEFEIRGTVPNVTVTRLSPEIVIKKQPAKPTRR
jgi:hypothetical protein